MIEQFLSPDLVSAIGWTLLHTLWQGALFALLLGVLLILLRSFSAQARYVVSVGMLGAFFLTVLFTFTRQFQPSQADAVATSTTQIVTQNENKNIAAPAALPTIETPSITPTVTTPGFTERSLAYFEEHLPLLVTLWLMGVLVLQLRFLGQIAFVQRLKSYGTERFPAEWAGRIQELEEALQVTRSVRYLTSVRVSSPLTVGWLRPAVLFPRELLNELRESQIVAVLAHELAHVRRHDFAVNLLQTFLATFFFYHPGLWWISARIHDEREHACDDLAIEATGQRLDYAKTLVQLQESQLITPRLSMAYTGQNGRGFTGRVKRLLSGYFGTATYGEGIITTLIFVLTFGLAVSATGNAQRPADDQPLLDTEAEIALTEATPQQQTDPKVVVTIDQHQDENSTPSNHTDIAIDGQDFDFNFEDHYVDFSNVDFSKLSATEEFRYLLSAIFQGEMELFQYFLKRVDNLNQAGGWEDHYFSPLMAAASENEVEMMRLLIDKGADVNFINPDGWTALIEAADEGAYEAAKLLLDSGAKVNLRGDQTRVTALSMAASEGHPEIVELLLDAGAQPESDLSIHAAAGEGEISIVELLVRKGLDPNERDDHGRTPLMTAAAEGKREVVRYLLDQDAKINARSNDGMTAILFAAAEGKSEVIRLLLENGADPDALTNDGKTALHLAAGEGKDAVVRLLVNGKADLDVKDNNGRTPLHYAGAEDKKSTVRLLLRLGADPNVVDNAGNTPAVLAAQEGARGYFEALREGEADGEESSDEYLEGLATMALENLRNSPEILIGPAAEGHLFMVRSMLETGIDINISDDRGRTALSEAAAEGHAGIVDYLLNHGAKVNGAGGGACTPLFAAAREGQYRVVEELLKARADVQLGCSFKDIDAGLDYSNVRAISLYTNASPLLVAINEVHTGITQQLIDARAQVNQTFVKSQYDFGNGSNWGQVARLSKEDLDNRYEEIYDTRKWTPLMEAVESGNTDLVQMLLDAGADKSAALEDGTTALDLARKMKLRLIVNLLD